MTWRRAAALALAAVAGAVGIGGCQKVTKTVAASVSPCFKVLPEAHAAIGGQGKFVDVARIRGRAVTLFPRLPATTTTTGSTTTVPPSTVAPSTGGGSPTTVADAGRRDVCLVAYRGTFDPSRIERLIGTRQGRYAVVVVGVSSRRVRAVLLTDTLPKPLRAH